jgi:ABC-2 type transport system ATP-binding protein
MYGEWLDRRKQVNPNRGEMAPIIQIKDLTKRYGPDKNPLMAVQNLNLEVGEGEIFGFVGPNGAGKTTTLRIMATLLQPTQGDIWVAGHSVCAEPRKVRQVIGYMPDYFGVYHDMTVWEYLDFFAACYQIPPSKRKALIADLLELVDLSHRLEDMVDGLSRGMKQRLSLARTLIHDPHLLILDEPASGLDPRARIEMRSLLLELARLGKTIFFSTHILADVAEICNRVGIIEAGELVAAGELETLQQHLIPHRRIQMTLLGNLQQAVTLLEATNGIQHLQQALERGNGRMMLEFDFAGDDQALSRLLASLVSEGIPLIQFSSDNRDMEEVFMRATKGLVT